MSVDVVEHGAVVDVRAVAALPDASADVAQAWPVAQALSHGDPPGCGLAAGDRPAADVEVLAGMVGCVEFELARRMHAARAAGGLPLHDPGALLGARGWSVGYARRLARAGGLAACHPSVAAAWAAGLITSEHVDPVARAAEKFTPEELVAVVAELAAQWGAWSPSAVSRFVTAADRLLHPPDDPSRDEVDAYQTRSLSFALTKDTVLISAELPRLEGEAVIAAIGAFAERMRSTQVPVPAGARRADALVELVHAAAAAGRLPTRAGLPVALTVTVAHTALGDPVLSTGLGHALTAAETRWACCDAQVTPILVTPARCSADPIGGPGTAGTGTAATARPSPAARVAALAALLFDTRLPLAVGRTSRTATPAQRRALAVRDKGCVIPGCTVPADACQAHHLTDWANGGHTNLDQLALLCWGHHRQVDLKMWTIEPSTPTLAAGSGTSQPASQPATSWPANNGAPFTITRTPRYSWRT